MTADEGPHAKVSLNTIYEVSLDTQRRVIKIEGQLDELSADSKDHENRIRALEKRVWVTAGAALIGGAGLSEVIGQVFSS